MADDVGGSVTSALIVILMLVTLYISFKGLATLYDQLSGSIQADVHVSLAKDKYVCPAGKKVRQ